MTGLPVGTVTLLFSDIEGSTVLLSRLGAAYGDALDEHRRVLRAAWAAHGGTELGTEGDSFFVVFPTAEGAVAAATRVQQELAALEWPGGEAVRVRIGIHTGTPAVRDEGYVGMDVHRAARIAGASHGGQVVVSEVTAKLVVGCLPDGVSMRDLGSHHLKDIAVPERLFQLVISGLPAEFPPPRTLGTASSLPRPPTPLVGRDGELAELTELVGSSGVRLVTLTGPGGTGKTRLAVGVAERLVDQFPDGVYFVALAAVTTSEVMWTSIAEVLDVPAEGRIPPGFFEHVAARTALFVLDNLEQVTGADAVVDQLLEAAPQVVVVATSRRPLHLVSEFEHPVPPLEVPLTATVTEAEGSGAVQLFVQQARKVRPGFALTPQNVADVVAVCRRLDGLPLAVELAAARVKLLTPKALLPRLDKALDLAAASTQGRPSRQATLRETIAWSYDLLTTAQQAFFRRLGVFAGGADLEAVAAVTADVLDGPDPLDHIADLVDASLLTMSEGPDGEPRVIMLETIRAYAQDQLRAAEEYDVAHHSHLSHYFHVAQDLHVAMYRGAAQQAVLEAARAFEIEHDNLREALEWSLGSAHPNPDRVQQGVELCLALPGFWTPAGYLAEARGWLERALAATGGRDEGLHTARCLSALAEVLRGQGEFDRSLELTLRAERLFDRFHDDAGRSGALLVLGTTYEVTGDPERAKAALEQALSLAESAGEERRIPSLMSELAHVAAMLGDLERSLELDTAAAQLFARLGGNLVAGTAPIHNSACTLRQLGRPAEAYRRLVPLVQTYLQQGFPDDLVVCAEDLAAILADLHAHELAIRLLGAADAMRQRHAMPRSPSQDEEIADPLARARAALSPEQGWDEYELGRSMRVEDALKEAAAAPVNLDH